MKKYVNVILTIFLVMNINLGSGGWINTQNETTEIESTVGTLDHIPEIVKGSQGMQ